MPQRVVVLGAGGTGLYMAETVQRVPGLELAGLLDDDPAKLDENCCGYPVLGTLKAWRDLSPDHLFLTSLYGPKNTPPFENLIASLEIPNERWITVVDPLALVSAHVSMEFGCFVGPFCVLEPRVTLGSKCALLGNVYLAHDAVLSEYTVCANSVSIAGGVKVGRASYIGANASLREYTAIGNCTVIGAGSVVVEDIPNGETVIGNPARPLNTLRSRSNAR